MAIVYTDLLSVKRNYRQLRRKIIPQMYHYISLTGTFYKHVQMDWQLTVFGCIPSVTHLYICWISWNVKYISIHLRNFVRWVYSNNEQTLLAVRVCKGHVITCTWECTLLCPLKFPICRGPELCSLLRSQTKPLPFIRFVCEKPLAVYKQ